MSSVVAAFERIVAGHDSIGSPLRGLLAPGADPTRLTASIPAGPGKPLLVDLWAWHDGVDHSAARDVGLSRILVFSQAAWLSAAEAEEWRRWLLENRAAIDQTRPVDDVWRESWYPVFAIDGDYLAVDLASESGAVWVVRFEDLGGVDPTRRLAGSLSGFLDGVAAQFEDGEYGWDGEINQLTAADGTWVDLFEQPAS